MKAKRGLALLMVAGIAVLLSLVGYFGFASVAAALAAVGWGLFLIPLFHLVPLLLSSLGWQALHSGTWPSPIAVFLRARWIRESIDGLLPVGQVGGELIGARMLTKHGAKASAAVAGCIVDLTMEVVSQFFFGLVGLGLLVARHGYSGPVYWLIVGVCVAAPALLGFVLAQRWGLFKLVERGLESLAQWLGLDSLGQMTGLHDAIAAIHRDRRGLAVSFMWHFSSWVIGAGEIWLALHFMGQPADFGTALILESLGQAVRSAAFVVPGAFGVQEVGFVVLGAILGLDPEVGLAVSLVKRVRDLALGLPGLLAWQLAEGHTLMRWLKSGSSPTGRRQGE